MQSARSASISVLPNAVGYLMAYCTAIADLAGGAPTLDAAATQELVARMERYRPNASLSFIDQPECPRRHSRNARGSCARNGRMNRCSGRQFHRQMRIVAPGSSRCR
jgi:hypothetical protein